MRPIRVLLLFSVVWAACAVAAPGSPPGVEEPLPGAMRTVEAEGAAPVIAGNVSAARQSAIQHALREAVENTFGVAVSAKLDVRNHTVLEDRIATRTSGYAMLEQILSEGEDAGIYRVRARVRVSARPPIQRAATYIRQWRVLVALIPATYQGQVGPGEPAAGIELAAQLQDAGLEMVAPRAASAKAWNADLARLAAAHADEVATWGRRQNADIVLIGKATARAWRGISLPVDWLPIDYTRCTAQVSLRAIRTDTGEVIAAEALSAEGDGTARAEAVRACLAAAARRIGRRLTETVLRLPGARSQPLQVVVTGLPRISEAQTLEDGLAGIPIVRRLERRSFSGGRLVLDVAVAAENANDLPVLLEDTFGLGSLQVHVDSASEGRIVASVARAE